ncbi:hypothetical protein GGH93_003381 [Coemansia aciculifera]|nr:hypothetical protein GGH93_003381 [Coemansia aciculifera]
MRPRTASCWALAATALLAVTTASASDIPHKRVGAAGPVENNAVAESGELGRHHRRGILDDIASIFNPIRQPRADGDSSSGGGSSGNNTGDDDNSKPTSDTHTPAPTSASSSTRSSTTPTTRSSTSTTPEETSSSTTPPKSSSSRTSSTRSSSTRSTPSSRSSEDKPTSDEPTSPTASPSPTPTSGMVIVTVTRPDVTITTRVPPPPIIDQSNGDKADVGTPSNLTTIIVAPSVTAVALLVCAILYYVYSKRRNRAKYGDEDIFAKGAGRNAEGSPFSQTNTSPFIPPEHSSSTRADGYIKEENNAFYTRTQPPRSTPSFNAHPMANPRYQQQAVPLVQPSNPVVVPGTARYMPPPAPPAQPRYGAMQSAPGYAATGERDSQFTETFAYEPPQHTNNSGYNSGGRQPHPGYHNGNGGHRG